MCFDSKRTHVSIFYQLDVSIEVKKIIFNLYDVGNFK